MDASGVVVGPCQERDWPRVIDLLMSVFVGEGHVGAERGRRDTRRETMEPRGTERAARQAGEVLGVVVLPHRESPLKLLAREGEAEIRMLAVDPRARGRGVGEMLVSECIRLASGPPHSARAIVLWTQPQMAAAQRLYERLGFIRVPERDTQLPAQADGHERLARWAYRRAL